MGSEKLADIETLELEMRRCINRFEDQYFDLVTEISNKDQVDMESFVADMVHQLAVIKRLNKHLHDTYVVNEERIESKNEK